MNRIQYVSIARYMTGLDVTPKGALELKSITGYPILHIERKLCLKEKYGDIYASERIKKIIS